MDVSRNFSSGVEFFLWTGKLRGDLGYFFLKNPSKLKRNSQKGGGLDPQKPLEFAHDLD